MRAFIPALLALAACASDSAPAPAEVAARIPAHLQLRHEIAPRVDVLIQAQTAFAGVVGNVTIIQQSDGVVLVDSGSSHGGGQRVVEHVRAITDLPVKAVIITHWHNDHPLGLSAILAAWPNAEIIATEATHAAMEGGRLGVPREASAEYEQRRVQQLQQALAGIAPNASDAALTAREREQWAIIVEELPQRYADQPGTHLVLPTRTFTERHVIADRATPIEVLFLGRANTDGDAMIWLPRQRILIAGDALVAPVPYMFNMYPSDQIATLEHMKALRPGIVVPGHGPVMNDTSYIDRTIALIRDVQAQVAAPAREGLTGDALRARTNFTAQQAAFVGDDPWLAYWFERYALAPLIESAVKEARGEPLGPPPLAAN